MPKPSFFLKHARVAGNLTLANPPLTEFGNGVKAGTGVTVVEQGDGVIHKTVLTLTNLVVAMVDAAANGSQGSQKLYDFPEGLIQILGSTMNLGIARVGTAIVVGAAVVSALGTVAPDANATLTGTEANLIPSTAATLTGGVNAAAPKGKSTATATFDGTSTPIDALLNFAIPDADSTGNDSLTVNGTITILWAQMGDV